MFVCNDNNNRKKKEAHLAELADLMPASAPAQKQLWLFFEL